MNLRTRIRRWRVGRDLYDLAVLSIATDPERDGRAQAHALIRKIHAQHPNPNRACIVPDCCERQENE